MKKLKVATDKKCSAQCQTVKPLKDFYMAADNIINDDGKMSICKQCLSSLVDYDNVETVIDIMRKVDRPFLISEYEASKTNTNPFGEYMRRMGMPQNKGKTYMHSQFNESLAVYKAKSSKDLSQKIEMEDIAKLKITPDMVAKWGSGYTESELFQLEQFYIKMKQSNDISTPQHIESLKILCKLSLKQNKALDEDEHAAFKNLNTQYNKVLQDSGFRPIDKTGSNESAGIRSFSQIWEEVEHHGFIPKHNIQVTQDIVDGTLLHTENYTRRLLNMQTVSEPSGDVPQVSDYQ